LLFDYIIIILNNNNNFKQDRTLLFYVRTTYNYKIQFYSINIIYIMKKTILLKYLKI